MLIAGITASRKTALSAYGQLLAEIGPDAWYRLNENSGTALFDSVSQSNLGLNSITNVQDLPIVDYTEDPGSLVAADAQTIALPNSITSWQADSDTLQSSFTSFWIKVDALPLVSTVIYQNDGDPTKWYVELNPNGSVTMKYSEFGLATSNPGLVVAGLRANISWWTEYSDLDATFSSCRIRYNVAGVALSGSSDASYAPTRFPNLNLGGYSFGNFDGEVDELIIRYGNAIEADSISQAQGIAWSQAIWDLQP
jgi:hypothetical protein